MLSPCPACGSFTLISNDLKFEDADAVLAHAPSRVHLNCTRCHWMGSGEASMQDNRLALTNVGHSDHVFW